MILTKPHLLTRIPVWSPKYSTQYGQVGERVALLARYKVDQGSPYIIVEFTEAQHLRELRFCIERKVAQTFLVVKNGKKATAIDCYEVPMSALEPWETVEEIRELVDSLFKD